MMDSLNKLQNLSADRMTLDEALMLQADGCNLEVRYKANGLEAPEWLADALVRLEAHVDSVVEDQIDAEIKMRESRLEALKTAGQKRTEQRAALAKLKKAKAARSKRAGR